MPSICFVSLNNYPVLSGDTGITHIGGAEVQQAILARELSRRGHRVSFVVLDHGQPDGMTIDGIQLFKCYRPDQGIRGLRFFHPRLTSLRSAMRRANADVYYQRGADSLTGLVAQWCSSHHHRFAFALAHDTNCDPNLSLLTSRLENILYRYGLHRADVIIAQTIRQQKLLQTGFQLSAKLVRSCGELVDPDRSVIDSAPIPEPNNSHSSFNSGPRILWVGRIRSEKRPDWLHDIATALPSFTFDVVGSCNADTPYSRQVIARLDTCPNVNRHGYIPHTAMEQLYRNTDALLCTSRSEGFPNTFLEAWASSKPVITTVDPDSIIKRHNLGSTANTREQLISTLTDLTNQPDRWKQYGKNAATYVQHHHGIESVVNALEPILFSTSNPFVRNKVGVRSGDTPLLLSR